MDEAQKTRLQAAFVLEVAPNNGGMLLQITGPAQTKGFIKNAFAL